MCVIRLHVVAALALLVSTAQVRVPGWVERDPMWCDPTGMMPIGGQIVCHYPIGTIHDKSSPGYVSFGTRYIRSMYTIFNSEFAYTWQESVFGVFGTLVIGFIYGGIAGVLSSLMMTQNAGEQEYMLKLIQVGSGGPMIGCLPPRCLSVFATGVAS